MSFWTTPLPTLPTQVMLEALHQNEKSYADHWSQHRRQHHKYEWLRNHDTQSRYYTTDATYAHYNASSALPVPLTKTASVITVH